METCYTMLLHWCELPWLKWSVVWPIDSMMGGWYDVCCDGSHHWVFYLHGHWHMPLIDKKVGVFQFIFLLFHLSSCFQADARHLRTYRSCCEQCWYCDNKPQFVGTNFGYQFGEFLRIEFSSISIDNTSHFLLIYLKNYWNLILAQHLPIYRNHFNAQLYVF